MSHIGLPKAGTISLQRHLFKHAGLLEENGCLYPKEWMAPNEFAHHRVRLAVLQGEPITTSCWQNLLITCGQEKMIIEFAAVFLRVDNEGNHDPVSIAKVRTLRKDNLP